MAEEVEAVSGAIMIVSRYRGYGSSTDDTAAAADDGDSEVVKRCCRCPHAVGSGRGKRYQNQCPLLGILTNLSITCSS